MSTTAHQHTLGLIQLEITGKCQQSCAHCYAGSGPKGTHGSMSREDWEKVIDQATGLEIPMIQFIGGEPMLHPDLPHLMRYALEGGHEVEVYSNLALKVPDEIWNLLKEPGASLGTSWYSTSSETHARITGRNSFDTILGNIDKAVEDGLSLRVSIIDLGDDQDAPDAKTFLGARGVEDIGMDRVRPLGRALIGKPSTKSLCGNCGVGTISVLPNGEVCPCPMARWINLGSVKESALRYLLPKAPAKTPDISLCGPNCPPLQNCIPWNSCSPKRG